MSRDHEGSSSGNTALIIIGVVFGVILLVVLGCVGVGFFMYRGVSGALATAMQIAADIQDANAAADTFVRNISAGQVDAAYDSATDGFRQRQTREEFKAFVDKNPLLKNYTSVQSLNMNQNQPSGRVTVQMTLSGATGTITVTTQLIKENGVWKVDTCTVP